MGAIADAHDSGILFLPDGTPGICPLPYLNSHGLPATGGKPPGDNNLSSNEAYD